MSRCHAAVAAVVFILVLGFVSGCKEKTKIKYRTDKSTVQALKMCEESREILQQQVVSLRLGKGNDTKPKDVAETEIVLRIEGKTIKVTMARARTNRNKPVVGDADAKALYKAFQGKVSASRGAFRKCYTNAMKKDPTLQGRVISMSVSVRFLASGEARGVRLSKAVLGTIFSNCMNRIVRKWKLPSAPSNYKFRAPITLTPQ